MAWAPEGMGKGHLFSGKDNKKAVLSPGNAMHAQIQWTRNHVKGRLLSK